MTKVSCKKKKRQTWAKIVDTKPPYEKYVDAVFLQSPSEYKAMLRKATRNAYIVWGDASHASSVGRFLVALDTSGNEVIAVSSFGGTAPVIWLSSSSSDKAIGRVGGEWGASTGVCFGLLKMGLRRRGNRGTGFGYLSSISIKKERRLAVFVDKDSIASAKVKIFNHSLETPWVAKQLFSRSRNHTYEHLQQFPVPEWAPPTYRGKQYPQLLHFEIWFLLGEGLIAKYLASGAYIRPSGYPLRRTYQSRNH
jgi:hypothetical protein